MAVKACDESYLAGAAGEHANVLRRVGGCVLQLLRCTRRHPVPRCTPAIPAVVVRYGTNNQVLHGTSLRPRSTSGDTTKKQPAARQDYQALVTECCSGHT